MNREQHQNGKFIYLADWPPEVLPAVEEALADLHWLVPAWCGEVCVTWYPTISDRAADMESDYTYRRARMRICAQFMDQDKAERVNVLRHELLHISTNVIVDYATDAIKRLLPDENDKPHYKTIMAGLSERHEGCVEDLTRCIQTKEKATNAIRN